MNWHIRTCSGNEGPIVVTCEALLLITLKLIIELKYVWHTKLTTSYVLAKYAVV